MRLVLAATLLALTACTNESEFTACVRHEELRELYADCVANADGYEGARACDGLLRERAALVHRLTDKKTAKVVVEGLTDYDAMVHHVGLGGRCHYGSGQQCKVGKNSLQTLIYAREVCRDRSDYDSLVLLMN